MCTNQWKHFPTNPATFNTHGHWFFLLLGKMPVDALFYETRKKNQNTHMWKQFNQSGQIKHEITQWVCARQFYLKTDSLNAHLLTAGLHIYILVKSLIFWLLYHSRYRVGTSTHLLTNPPIVYTFKGQKQTTQILCDLYRQWLINFIHENSLNGIW